MKEGKSMSAFGDTGKIEKYYDGHPPLHVLEDAIAKRLN